MKKYLSIFIITTILCMAGFVFGQLVIDWNPGNTVTVNAKADPWATVELSTTAVTLTYTATLDEDTLLGTVTAEPSTFTLTIDTNVHYVITASFAPDETNFSGKTLKLSYGGNDLLGDGASITGDPTTTGEPDEYTLTVAPEKVSDLKYFRDPVKIGTITFTVAEQ